jgi:hypothetical protein
MNIWDFSAHLTRRLLVWSVLSVLASVPIILSANPFWRGFAIQFLAWGGIDGAIAIVGARAATKKQATIQDSERLDIESKEARRLSRILWINTGLDVFYILGGLWLVQTWGAENPLWRGHGLGIVIQGGFLFLFDLLHAFSLRNLRLN